MSELIDLNSPQTPERDDREIPKIAKKLINMSLPLESAPRRVDKQGYDFDDIEEEDEADDTDDELKDNKLEEE